ncbi:flavodoxin domain-containing protein [Marinilactibacillus psychrotolerans]|uniref:flavodoxin domain-containing protein n=1 Tax=Marinilactibacillus psychrotolerans TaxID=191770 RepID=UPI003887B093
MQVDTELANNTLMKLERKKNIPVYSSKDFPNNLFDIEEIIYVGATYMGKILDLRKFIKKQAALHSKLIIISVGIYSPENLKTYYLIDKKTKSSIEKTNLILKKVYYLSGKLDIKNLSFKHKFLINLLYKNAKKKDLIELTKNELDIINAYEQTSDFRLSKLEKLMSEL